MTSIPLAMLTLESLAARVAALEAAAAPPLPTAPTRPTPPAGYQYNPNGDGTLQWVGGVAQPVINTVPNTTPPVPREWGVGARFVIRGLDAVMAPLVVTRVGDGLVFAWHDGQDASFYPNQCTLIEAAPL